MTSIVYQVDKYLGLDGVRNIFKTAHKNETRISTAPPLENIVPHGVYVYKVEKDTRLPYWEGDKFFEFWKCRRTEKYPSKDPDTRKKIFQLCGGLNQDGTVKYLSEKRCIFFEYGSNLEPPNNWKCPYVIVYYQGKFKEQPVNPIHGNKKDFLKKNSFILHQRKLGMSPGNTPLKYAGEENLQYCTPPKKPRLNASEENNARITKTTSSSNSTSSAEKIHKSKQNTSKKLPKTVTFGNAIADMNVQTFDNPATTKPTQNASTAQTVNDNAFRRKRVSNIESSTTDDSLSGESLSPARKDRNLNQCREKNSTTGIQHRKSRPSVKADLEARLRSGSTPAQAYRQAKIDAYFKHGKDTPSYLPRNPKQAQNIQYRIQKEKKHDDIMELYYLLKSHPDHFLKFVLGPNLTFVQTHPEVLKYLSSLPNTFKDKIFLHYDTTFDIGKYYTSILSLRNIYFQEQPLTPIAVMFHESRDTESHEVFFEALGKQTKLNNKSFVIVTDREGGIREAIKSKLGYVTQLFCWKHIWENVEFWVTKNLSPSGLSQLYKNAVITLLKSETEEAYNTERHNYFEMWDEKFVKYYLENLEVDIKQTYKPMLLQYEIPCGSSGITNNPAESTNAAFKRITNHKTADFYQAAYAWYFYQIGAIVDIIMSIDQAGRYTPVFESTPVRLYIPEIKHDVIDPNVILPLVFDGKFPPKFETATVYTSKYSPQTTMEGLGEMLLRKDRVNWIKKDRVFVVTGLNGSKYLVDLSNMSCTCVKSTLCEHLVAVQKGISIPSYKKLKRPQPSISAMYRKNVHKSAGSKRSQKIRNVELKKQPTLLSNLGMNKAKLAGKDIKTNVKFETDGSVDSIEKNSYGVELGSEKSCCSIDNFEPESCLPELKMFFETQLPLLNKTNYSKILFTYPTGNITLENLKTVCTSMTQFEVTCLQKLKSNFSIGTLDWMVDCAISAFLLRITNFEQDEVISLAPSEVEYMFCRGEIGNQLTKMLANPLSFDWNQINKVYMPCCVGGNHWILIILDINEGDIIVLDPMQSYKLTSEQQSILSKFAKSLPTPNPPIVWRSKKIDAKKDDCCQCGPFICFYAESVLKNWKLTTNFEISDYRRHILATIVGNCEILPDKRIKKCYCNGLRSGKFERCDICGKAAHLECMKSVKFRGKTYNICDKQRQDG